MVAVFSAPTILAQWTVCWRMEVWVLDVIVPIWLLPKLLFLTYYMSTFIAHNESTGKSSRRFSWESSSVTSDSCARQVGYACSWRGAFLGLAKILFALIPQYMLTYFLLFFNKITCGADDNRNGQIFLVICDCTNLRSHTPWNPYTTSRSLPPS